MSLIGLQIGAYEIRQHLGRGGIGEVFAGVDRMLDRPVAVKVLRPEFSRDTQYVSRFQAEAQILARLNHPNIATVYGLQREGNDLFMIMEFVQGQTLENIMASAGRLDEQVCLALMAQATDGLTCAHKTGIIHRDIKPSNMMVTGNGVLKIMDFGIARMRGSDRLTRQGHLVGTIAYMPPEQIQGHEGDERTDVYALAIVLYELLSGTTPFKSDSEYELLRLQMEAAPPRLVGRIPKLRPEIEAAVMCALAKDPSERFQTAKDFGQSLGVLTMGAQAAEIARSYFSGLVGQAAIASLSGIKPTDPMADSIGTRLAFFHHLVRPDATRLAEEVRGPRSPKGFRALIARTIIASWREKFRWAGWRRLSATQTAAARLRDATRRGLFTLHRAVARRPTAVFGTAAILLFSSIAYSVLNSVSEPPLLPTSKGSRQALQKLTETMHSPEQFPVELDVDSDLPAEEQDPHPRHDDTVPPEIPALPDPIIGPHVPTVEATIGGSVMKLSLPSIAASDYGLKSVTVKEVPRGGLLLHGRHQVQVGDELSASDFAALAFLPNSGGFGGEGTFSYQIKEGTGGPLDGSVRIVVHPIALPHYSLESLRTIDAELSSDDRRRIQKVLRTFRHYTGRVDGVFGNHTRAAIAHWQDFEGAEPTGYLTPEQIKRLYLLDEKPLHLLTVPDHSPNGIAAKSIPGMKDRFRRGLAYIQEGSAKDDLEGAYWFALAAAEGHAVALTALGTLYAHRQTLEDMATAELLWQMAGAAGEGKSLFNLGAMYEHGIGAGTDLAIALRWYQRAAAAANPDPDAAQAIERLKQERVGSLK